jgi:protein gp37
MKKTKIDWADYVWNPVTGCTKVSAGCKNCYAERHANRFWGERKFTDVICHEDRLIQPYHIKEPGRVFVNSMSDLFHPDVPEKFIHRIFTIMLINSHLTFIIPMPNIWLGVSVEDQKTADERIPILLQNPAAVRFVSYEPALGEVDISKYLITKFYNKGPEYSPITVKSIDWVIMGCESGPYRRPMDIDWTRSMRTQCQAANVPFFLKQMDVAGKVIKMPELDGKVWDQYPEGKMA